MPEGGARAAGRDLKPFAPTLVALTRPALAAATAAAKGRSALMRKI